MNLVQKALVGGCAVLAIAGAAWAGGGRDHVLDVALPDGGVVHINYAGNVAPRVELVPPADASDAAAPDLGDMEPLFFTGFDNADRAFAAMDRQKAAMSQAMQRVAAPGGGISRAALTSLPPGTVSYSVVMTSDGTHSCTRSTSMTAGSGGAKPQLISKTSGDCAPEAKQSDRPVMASTPARVPSETQGGRAELVSAQPTAAAYRQVGHY
jgi:hypothetical protein